MNQNDMQAIAKATAAEYGLPPELVCAIIEQESNWNPWAIRYEPGFERLYVKPADPLHPSTEQVARAISWGLMQIMGEVARERGYIGWLSGLCDPATGIEYGCRHLQSRMDVAESNVEKALLLYNGGGNPAYPGQVLTRVNKYR